MTYKIEHLKFFQLPLTIDLLKQINDRYMNHLTHKTHFITLLRQNGSNPLGFFEELSHVDEQLILLRIFYKSIPAKEINYFFGVYGDDYKAITRVNFNEHAKEFLLKINRKIKSIKSDSIIINGLNISSESNYIFFNCNDIKIYCLSIYYINYTSINKCYIEENFIKLELQSKEIIFEYHNDDLEQIFIDKKVECISNRSKVKYQKFLREKESVKIPKSPISLILENKKNHEIEEINQSMDLNENVHMKIRGNIDITKTPSTDSEIQIKDAFNFNKNSYIENLEKEKSLPDNKNNYEQKYIYTKTIIDGFNENLLLDYTRHSKSDFTKHDKIVEIQESNIDGGISVNNNYSHGKKNVMTAEENKIITQNTCTTNMPKLKIKFDSSFSGLHDISKKSQAQNKITKKTIQNKGNKNKKSSSLELDKIIFNNQEKKLLKNKKKHHRFNNIRSKIPDMSTSLNLNESLKDSTCFQQGNVFKDKKINKSHPNVIKTINAQKKEEYLIEEETSLSFDIDNETDMKNINTDFFIKLSQDFNNRSTPAKKLKKVNKYKMNYNKEIKRIMEIKKQLVNEIGSLFLKEEEMRLKKYINILKKENKKLNKIK